MLLIIFAAFFPETCRNVVGNGSIPARGVAQSVVGYLQQRRHAREGPTDDFSSVQTLPRKKSGFPNPLATLKILLEKESCIVLLYNALFFTGMMVVSASIPTLYEEVYGLNSLHTGLCYITMGMGSLLSTLTMGHAVDWNFRRHARQLGMTISKTKQQDLSSFPIEKVRFQVVVPSHVIGTASIIVYGWTLDYHTHLAWPEVALFFLGFGVTTAFNITNTLLIDLHRDKPATATAAINFTRCLMSAGGAAAILPMCTAMGIGWAFTFIALIYVVLILAVFWLMAKGMGWRKEAEELKRAKETASSRPASEDLDAEEISVGERKPGAEPVEQDGVR